MPHPALVPDAVAVITGGASGIGLAAARTPEETVDFLLARLGDGDFHILCPGNDVPRALDERRIPSWRTGRRFRGDIPTMPGRSPRSSGGGEGGATVGRETQSRGEALRSALEPCAAPP